MTANSTIFFIGLAPFVAAFVGVVGLLLHSRRPPETLRTGVLDITLKDLRRQRRRFVRELEMEQGASITALAAEFAPGIGRLAADAPAAGADPGYLRDAA